MTARPVPTTPGITRRHALGLAASATLGTVLGGSGTAQAATAAQDLTVITANFGRGTNPGAYEASMRRLRNGIKIGGETVRSLVGFQEINEGDQDPDLEHQLINKYFGDRFQKVSVDKPGNLSSLVPIVVPPPYAVVAVNAVKAHDGIRKVTPERWITEAVLQDTGDPLIRFAVLNTHYIAGAWNGKASAADRRPFWNTHFQLHKERIAFYHQQGLPVIWTGDVNRRSMPRLHPMEQRAFQAGIDQIRWIPGTNGTRLTLRSTREVNLTIDAHNARVARLRIRRV